MQPPRRRARAPGTIQARRSLCVLLSLSACQAQPEAIGPYEGLKACQRGEGLCGEVAVPLDPADPTGAQLSLAVRVLPARTRSSQTEAVYVLVGGPGQAATEVGPLLSPVLERLATQRDIIFVDQRGTGGEEKSASLRCDVELEGVEALFSVDFPDEKLRDCLKGYEHSPKFFTTEASVADLELVRAHFRHDRVHLFGLSYGTRLALAYIRRHPKHVVSAVLDGVAPPSISLASDMDRGAHEVLERTFDDCEASPACAEAFPGLRGRFDEWLAIQTLAGPQSGPRLGLQHPRTGERGEAVVAGKAVMATLRTAIYSPETAALIPLSLERLMRGDGAALVGLAGSGEGLSQTLSLGLFLSIVCSEDMRHVDPAELAWSRSNTRFAARMYDDLRRVCDFWPRGEVPEDFRSPVESSVPVLLLSGELDPATPPAWADEAARHLSRAHQVVVPGVGHGTWHEGCVPKMIADFIKEGGSGPIEVSCVEGRRRAPFFVSEAGPSMGTQSNQEVAK